jgi:hypothetical protein
MSRVPLRVRAAAELELRRRQRERQAAYQTPELYTLHEGQQSVADNPARFKVVVCGRRWGKSRLALYLGVKAAFEGSYPYDPASPPVVVFAMPTLKQCKKIFWKPLLNLLQGHPLIHQINKSEMTITLKGQRPEIVCVGVNDSEGDRLRGLRIAHICLDEYQDIKPGIMDEVIRPAMSDTENSAMLVTGTPKGKVNHLYKLDLLSKQRDDQVSFRFYTVDNPHIDRDEIRNAEATLEPRVFRQEYMASYEDFPGQIFDHLDDRHIARPIPDIFKKVVMGVDWGDVNPALLVAGQDNDGLWWVIDTWYSSSGINIRDDEFMAHGKRLAERWGVYKAWAGHDRPASIEKWNQELPCLVESWQKCNPFGSCYTVAEGNSLVNSLLYHDKLFLNPSLGTFKDKMGSYHRAQDKNGNVMEAIAAGQDDHEVDCLRMAIASEEYATTNGLAHRLAALS